MNILLYVLIAIAIILLGWIVGVYNGLIRKKLRVNEAWSDIAVQLKRRYDLIPNLIETVKGYAKHESTVFQKVTEARANALNAQSVDEKGKAENMLSGALKSLFAVSENYPDLKANENFLQLQDELTDTENKIQASRRFYNGNVRDFNTAIQVFPNNIIANIFNFAKREFFALDDEKAKEAVKVKF